MNINKKYMKRFLIGGCSVLLLILSTATVLADFLPGDCAGYDPVSYWKLEEAGILIGINYDFNDEAPGDNWGACNNFDEHKCPSQTTGQVGFGQGFSEVGNTGVDVEPYEDIDWNSTTSFSLELWMKGSQAEGTDVLLGRTTKQADPDGAGMEWFLGVNSGTRSALFWMESAASTNGKPDSVQIHGISDVLNNEWHHIVVVRDGIKGRLQLWINGVMEASIEASFNGNFSGGSEPLTIGYLDKANFFHYNGTIDEIAVYATVLPETHIVQHFNDGDTGLDIGYCGDPIRIMPLGDSITMGSLGDDTPDSQIVGFRQKLYQDLFDVEADGTQDYNINFMGSLENGTDFQFDWDHEGHSGAMADEVRDDVAGYLSASPADVVLLHIGTNDIGIGQDPWSIHLEVNDLLDAIYGSNPAAAVVMAEIIGRTDSPDMNAKTIELNSYLRDLVDDRHSSNPDEQLILVDQYNALDYPGDMNSDGIHPNATGYQKMADAWYNVIVTLLTDANGESPLMDGADGGGGGGGGCFIDILRY